LESHAQGAPGSLPETEPFQFKWLERSSIKREHSPAPRERATRGPAGGQRENPSQRRQRVVDAVDSVLHSRAGEAIAISEIYESVFDSLDFVPTAKDVRLVVGRLVRDGENYFKIAQDVYSWSPDANPPAPPTPPHIIAMMELRRNGLTLDEVGRQFGVTRERVRQLMKKYGGPDSAAVRQAQIERTESEEQSRGTSVTLAIRDVLNDSRPRSAEEVASQTGKDSSEIVKCWPKDLAHLRLWGTSKAESRWSDDEITDAIREAALYAFPLTANAYKRLLEVGQIQGPSSARIGQRYGSWTAACEAAGVTAGRTVRHHYQSKWSDHDLADIVRQYLLDPSVPNSANRFDEWKRENVPDGPSFQTVRNRFGSRTEAKRRVLTPTGSERE